MASAPIDFDAPDLAMRVERLSQYDLDRLPFGVVLLDAAGMVQFYSETEARQSGNRGSLLGKNFFAIARGPGREDFRVRIMQALEQGPVDLEFAWPDDLRDPTRDLRVRVQSSRAGGFWIFIERENL